MTMFGFVVQMGGLEKKAERRLAEQTAAIGNASTTAERPGLGVSGRGIYDPKRGYGPRRNPRKSAVAAERLSAVLQCLEWRQKRSFSPYQERCPQFAR